MRPGILGFVRLDTSFGEASSRTQATDPNRRETLRIRTPLPGLRGEAKWLRKRLCFRNKGRATPWSAKALTREVTTRPRFPRRLDGAPRLVSCVLVRYGATDEGRRAMDSDSPGRSWPFPPLSLSAPST